MPSPSYVRRRDLQHRGERGRARVLVAEAALAEIARAALGGDDGLGIFHALLRGGHGVRERVLRALARVQRGFERVARGDHGVEHRLFPGDGLAAQLHARDERVQDREKILRVQLRLPGQRLARLHECRAVERPGRAADRRHEGHTGSLEHGADVLALHHRALFLNLGEAAGQIDPVVAVADDVVELGEI